MRIFDLSQILDEPNIVPISVHNIVERLKQAYKIAEVNGNVFLIKRYR